MRVPASSRPTVSDKKNVIITGATGMIGSLVLQQCLARDDVRKVTSVSRSPLGIQHEKLTGVVHQDFLDLREIERHFRSQDVCFFCIGVYSGKSPAEEFRKITVDYTRAFAETLRKYNDGLAFCFLSGMGADSSERSSIQFARDKGAAENILLNLKFARTHIFRPGYIYPVTPRKEPNAMYTMMRILYKPLSAIYPNIGVPSTKLAAKMVEAGLNCGDRTIYENRDIRK